MSWDQQRSFTISFRILCGFLMCTGIGWLGVAYYIGHDTTTASSTVASKILEELAKALFIGSVIGLLARRLTDEATVQGPLEKGGIEDVYAKRTEMASVLLEEVRDPRTRNLRIAGISLRDFLLETGALRPVWTEIADRLRHEAKNNLPLPDRLKVRILLLDPHCPEGDFRFEIERGALAQGLRQDVPMAVKEVDNIIRELLGDAPSTEVLEVREYQHGSFGFQFITDSLAIVEPYTYRDQRGNATIPSVRYTRSARAYEPISHSYEIVWAHSAPPRKGVAPAGVGQGLRESQLVGIYRHDQRGLLGERQRQVLASSGPGDLINIQALSGRFYMHPPTIGAIEQATQEVGHGAKVRLLIINPTSRSAILRAVADGTPVEDVSRVIRKWTWNNHKSSNLYRDVHAAIQMVKNLRDASRDIELRLSAADLSCAMLLTREGMFTEQYAYGRSSHGRVILGGEYAVFEYSREAKGNATSEERILESAFEVIWDSYSISADEYLKRVEVDEASFFTRELEVVQAELESEPNADISMVILAAGYGTRIAADLERLRPDLKGRPKALLPVGSKPLLEWLLDSVKGIKLIKDITVVTNEAHFEAFQAWWRDAPNRSRIKIISDGTKTNEQRRGALGSLRFAVDREGIRGNVLVVGSDNFFDGDFQEVVDTFTKTKKGIVVVHDESSVERVAGKLGVAKLADDGSNRIIDFEEKPNRPLSTLASTLCYLFTDRDIRLLKGYAREGRPDNTGDFIRYLVRSEDRLQAFTFKGKWYDVGSYSEYRALDEMLSNPRGAVGAAN